MSKRARRKGVQPRAAARKTRALGLPLGLSRKLMDYANEISLREFGLGIGVLLQEDERARNVLASIEQERAGRPWFARGQFTAAWTRAKRDAELWSGRLQKVVDEIASRRSLEQRDEQG